MKTQHQLHAHPAVKGGSDRSFGWVFACFWLIVGLAPLRHGQPPRLPALAASAAFLVAALLRPQILHPLNVAWTWLGVQMGRVVTPIVLALLFFVVVTPIAVLMRVLGKRPLKLRWEPGAESYWIHRQPPGPPPESMINQF